MVPAPTGCSIPHMYIAMRWQHSGVLSCQHSVTAVVYGSISEQGEDIREELESIDKRSRSYDSALSSCVPSMSHRPATALAAPFVLWYKAQNSPSILPSRFLLIYHCRSHGHHHSQAYRFQGEFTAFHTLAAALTRFPRCPLWGKLHTLSSPDPRYLYELPLAV